MFRRTRFLCAHNVCNTAMWTLCITAPGPHLRTKPSRPVAIAGICSTTTTSTRRHRCILLPPQDTCTSPGSRIASGSRSLTRRYIQVDLQGHRTYVGRSEKELCLCLWRLDSPRNLIICTPRPYVWSSISLQVKETAHVLITCRAPLAPCDGDGRCRFSTSRNVDRDAGTHT